jgi:hypothetical protein
MCQLTLDYSDTDTIYFEPISMTISRRTSRNFSRTQSRQANVQRLPPIVPPHATFGPGPSGDNFSTDFDDNLDDLNAGGAFELPSWQEIDLPGHQPNLQSSDIESEAHQSEDLDPPREEYNQCDILMQQLHDDLETEIEIRFLTIPRASFKHSFIPN